MIESDETFITMEVTGTGSTVESARKDAFKNALGLAVGTLVDSDIVVSDEGVFERVITVSNSYFKEHVVLSEKREEGLWKVAMLLDVTPSLQKLRRMIEFRPKFSGRNTSIPCHPFF